MASADPLDAVRLRDQERTIATLTAERNEALARLQDARDTVHVLRARAEAAENDVGCKRARIDELEAVNAKLEAVNAILRLVLLAEQGDPAGAPSEGWRYDGPLGQWLHGGISVRRLVQIWTWMRTSEGARACWWWDVPGGAEDHAPTAREAMEQADRATEGEQG